MANNLRNQAWSMSGCHSSGGRVFERLPELELGMPTYRRFRPPQMGVGIGRLPLREVEMVDLVGADEMRDPTQTVHPGLEFVDELDGRPDPKVAIVEACDHRARWIGSAVKANDLALGQPKRIGNLLEHRSTFALD
jgi:hypothetical protein